MAEPKFRYFEDQEIGVAVNKDGDIPLTLDGTMVCLLQDIRRELKQLNATIKSTRFLAVPHNPEDDK